MKTQKQSFQFEYHFIFIIFKWYKISHGDKKSDFLSF